MVHLSRCEFVTGSNIPNAEVFNHMSAVAVCRTITKRDWPRIVEIIHENPIEVAKLRDRGPWLIARTLLDCQPTSIQIGQLCRLIRKKHGHGVRVCLDGDYIVKIMPQPRRQGLPSMSERGNRRPNRKSNRPTRGSHWAYQMARQNAGI
jgi:hypothetical protein